MAAALCQRLRTKLETTMPDLSALEADIRSFRIELLSEDWAPLRPRFSEIEVSAGTNIQTQARVAETWVFLTSGIAASEQTWGDGTHSIARFFERGDFCANITSIWTQTIASDDLRAITNVTGISLPNEVFEKEYMTGGPFGAYLRLKMIDAHLFAKDLICAKTSAQTETRYRFLEQRHASVIADAPKKDIARFLGVTPQGLSRFLKRRKLKNA